MLKQRVITALVIAPLTIAGIVALQGLAFALFIGLFIVISGWEWADLAGLKGHLRITYAGFLSVVLAGSYFLSPKLVLTIGLCWWLGAFVLVICYPKLVRYWSSKMIRCAIGLVILVPAWVAMLQLKLFPDGTLFILLLFFLVWGSDTGAYFSGRAFGKRKLSPEISPGKTWAGFYGGLATALLIAVIMPYVTGKSDLVPGAGVIFLGGCLFVAMVSVLGDLTISMFKRHAGVKNSSNLLPGHGGFLDRIDSLLAAAPVFVALILFSGWVRVS